MNRKSLVPGLALILIGVWALLWSLGCEWVSMDRLWPLVIMILGLLSLINGLRSKESDSDSVWFGLAALGSGGVFLYITLISGEWGDMSRLWPAFPAIAGVAWIAEWLTDRQAVARLTLGLTALTVGAIGYFITQGVLEKEKALSIVQLWPLALVLVGLGLVIQFLVQRRSS